MEGIPTGTTIPCVGAIVRDERGRLLLVRRRNEPGAGRWSVPGGRIEADETPPMAVVREVEEETHLRVTVDGFAGLVERPAPGGGTFVIEDFYARAEPGADPHAIKAGDDATEVGWFSPLEVPHLDCVEGLVDALRGWRVIP